ncbi:MAG: DUF86 domain-containing protein [Myxococcales bacterium]|nr:DUF86 domain-containing protein [Myxococcales bacterium]
MVDPDVFARRLAKLEELLTQLRELSRAERERFLTDRALQAQAERWLHLAAERTLDLANHLIADRGWPTPGTYREAFRTLAERGVLPPDLAKKMEAWAGLRNVLVHMYLDVDHATIHQILTHDLDELEAFARAVAGAT